MSKIIYKGSDAKSRESLYNVDNKGMFSQNEVFSTMEKDRLFIYLLYCFDYGILSILYDENIGSIKPRVQALDPSTIPDDTAVLFFTSGTTGEPTGALKSKDNILEELEVLKALVAPLGIERVVVTVPLIHIYGFLAGVMLPRALGAEVVLKEEFLPHELISLAEDKKTLCITNPVFLKVLNKLKIEKECSHITFLSSTGKLEADTACSLHERLGCRIYQLFGSTETGGIAYKYNSETIWRTLNGVHVEKIGQNLGVSSPFVSKYILGKNLKEVAQPFVTSDIIRLEGEGFVLLGRESEIIKISGKRISLLEIESLLEQHDKIDEVLVQLSYSVDSHKDEQLKIMIRSQLEEEDLKKIVKTTLQEHYKKINIRSIIQRTHEIAKNHMGKKIRR